MKNNIINNFRLDENKLRKIGSFALTVSLIAVLSTPAKGDETICNPGAFEYHKRIYEYSRERTYSDSVKALYENSQINIDGELYPIDKFFITINSQEEGYGLHLKNIKSEYSDILTGSKENYAYDSIIRFRDTTAFIELINSDCVLIDYEKKIIVVIDKEKALEIIKNWDGMIHNAVPETDAIENKDFFKKVSK